MCSMQETNSLLDLLLGEDSQTHTPTHTASQGETEELVELRAQINQRLQRELTGFINTLLHRLRHTTDRCSRNMHPPPPPPLSLFSSLTDKATTSNCQSLYLWCLFVRVCSHLYAKRVPYRSRKLPVGIFYLRHIHTHMQYTHTCRNTATTQSYKCD